MLSIIYHINTLRYAVPTAIMMGCAPPFWTMAADWHVLSYLLPERWYRAVDDKIWGTYQRLIEFFFEHYTGVEVRSIWEWGLFCSALHDSPGRTDVTNCVATLLFCLYMDLTPA